MKDREIHLSLLPSFSPSFIPSISTYDFNTSFPSAAPSTCSRVHSMGIV